MGGDSINPAGADRSVPPWFALLLLMPVGARVKLRLASRVVAEAPRPGVPSLVRSPGLRFSPG